ncbi:pkb-activating kinase-like protein [Linnemannia zychae]|nr:pkb-activating kinase-like protein [Linnemannia zychae]
MAVSSLTPANSSDPTESPLPDSRAPIPSVLEDPTPTSTPSNPGIPIIPIASSISTSSTASAVSTTTTPPTPIPQPTQPLLVTNMATPPNQLQTTENDSTSTSTDQAAVETTVSTNGTTAVPTAAAPVSAVPARKRTLADYRLGRTLGEGSYSTVVSAVDLNNRRDYAIKVLDKRHIIREKKVKYVNIEKNTLYKLDHPGVVKLYSTFQDSTSLYYVLELCRNGELLTYIKKLGSFDENCTRFYVAQILTAIEYVHSQGVIHRDLKPENILLDDQMYVKLTDFGTAKMLEPSEDGTESDRANSFVGTAEYVSPELLTEKAACKSSDLWALGCIIYQLLAGRPPFKGSNEYQTFQKIVRLEYTFPAGFPRIAMDLVSRLLVHDPNERLGANNTIDELKKHPFFDGVNWSELWTQPAPRLMPYLPPTPTHNTEALRSDHDACLWSMNRTGETLMVVDPFREIGDSGSSVNNSGRNSINGHGNETDESDGLHVMNPGVHDSTSSTETTAIATPTSQRLPLPSIEDSPSSSHPIPSTPSIVLATTEESAGSSLLTSDPTTTAPGTANPKTAPTSGAVGTSTMNGHVKAKSGSRNVFVALFSGSRHTSGKKLLGKKAKATEENGEPSQQRPQTRHGQVERLVGGVRKDGNTRKSGGISRENSSVSLAVTANEVSAYSRRTQLELQAELSPWQSFLLPTELILFQTPILKRKGLFSRSCILVLTDFPRLLYFDDSNHYFSQLFNSNTNEAFGNWQQQQTLLQWEQTDPSHVLQQHEQEQGTGSTLSKKPSLRQAIARISLDHPHSNPHPRRNTGGLDGITNGSGFLLNRHGSHSRCSDAQHKSEQTLPLGTEGKLPEDVEQDTTVTNRSQVGQSPRASMEESIQPHSHLHSHSHPHSHLHPHPRHQNKIDADKHVSGAGSANGLEPSEMSGRTVEGGLTNDHSSNTSNISASDSIHGNGMIVGNSGSNGNSMTVSQSGSKIKSSSSSVGFPGTIKAAKKQAKLRGEVLLTASVVSELKGKKCFFIHTTKKSYYFEESNHEGDAKTWVKVLERSMEGWFGEGGGSADGLNGETNGPAVVSVAE